MKTVKIVLLCSLLLMQTVASQAENDLDRLGREIKNLFSRLEKSKHLDIYFQDLAENTEVKVVSDKVVKRSKTDITRHIILSVPSIKNFGEIHLKKRDPINSKSKSLATAFLLAGAYVGMDSIDLVPSVPNTSVVTMDYGIKESPNDMGAFEIVKKLWSIQAQFLVAYTWLEQQKDVNPFRLSSVNVSFGNYLAPYPLRVLKAVGKVPHATVFAFGGSSLSPFIEKGLEGELSPQNIARITDFLKPVLNIFDPSRHLAYLEGPFLLIKASDETIIPEASFQALFNNLPEPKEVVKTNGSHVDVDQLQVIKQSVQIIFDWLAEQPQSAPY